MIRKRAFTMVEMMCVVALTGVIVGVMTAVYAFTIQRMGYGIADVTTQQQAEYGLDGIDAVIAKAQTCTIVPVGPNQCLKCTMPANCVDTNGDGILDSCSPNAVNRRSLERWGNGYRVWFYQANATGIPSNPGTILWEAKRMDDVTPGAGDLVKYYTYFPGNTKVRLALIQTLTPAAGTYTNQFTATLKFGAYGGVGQQVAPVGAATNTSYQLSLSRTPYMHGWRL